MAHNITVVGFDGPAKLPANAEQKANWQRENRTWWENNPMRYDWRSPLTAAKDSQEFFEEIDKRFFEAAKSFLPCRVLPFDALIDFDSLGDKDVLEIGVGCGSHASLLAPRSRSFVGIDLTEYAVRTTTTRMRLLGTDARVLQMDAENLRFDANSFDLIWTWGVIHHSSDTGAVLKEMQRVLRPGGTAITMVYHRNWWHYYLCHGLLRGIFGGDLLKLRSLHQVVQKHTDGALARYFTRNEWQDLVSQWFNVQAILIYGSKAELIPLPGETRIKSAVMRMLPDSVGRFATNRLRMGSFLVTILQKP